MQKLKISLLDLIIIRKCIIKEINLIEKNQYLQEYRNNLLNLVYKYSYIIKKNRSDKKCKNVKNF